MPSLRVLIRTLSALSDELCQTQRPPLRKSQLPRCAAAAAPDPRASRHDASCARRCADRAKCWRSPSRVARRTASISVPRRGSPVPAVPSTWQKLFITAVRGSPAGLAPGARPPWHCRRAAPADRASGNRRTSPGRLRVRGLQHFAAKRPTAWLGDPPPPPPPPLPPPPPSHRAVARRGLAVAYDPVPLDLVHPFDDAREHRWASAQRRRQRRGEVDEVGRMVSMCAPGHRLSAAPPADRGRSSPARGAWRRWGERTHRAGDQLTPQDQPANTATRQASARSPELVHHVRVGASTALSAAGAR